MEPSLWIRILLVAVGGMTGCVARYLLTLITRAPYGIWIINVTACIVTGFIFGLYVVAPWTTGVKTGVRLFFMIGLMGGFSSFAHFMLYCVNYFRDGQMIFGWTYFITMLLVGFLFMVTGIILGVKCYQ